MWKSIDGVAIWNDLLHNSSEPKTSSNIFHSAKREKWNKNTVEQGRRTHKTQNSDVGARRRRYGITFWTETSAPSPPPYNNNIISKDIESDLCHEKRSCCCSYFVDGTSYPRVLFFLRLQQTTPVCVSLHAQHVKRHNLGEIVIVVFVQLFVVYKKKGDSFSSFLRYNGGVSAPFEGFCFVLFVFCCFYYFLVYV